MTPIEEITKQLTITNIRGQLIPDYVGVANIQAPKVAKGTPPYVQIINLVNPVEEISAVHIHKNPNGTFTLTVWTENKYMTSSIPDMQIDEFSTVSDTIIKIEAGIL